MKLKMVLLLPVVFMLACSGPKVHLNETAGSEPLDEQIALTTEEEWRKISLREKSYVPKTIH